MGISSRVRDIIRKPTVFEWVVFLAGIALLATYVQLRADQESLRAEGIDYEAE